MNQFLVKTSNKYLVISGILSAWILCYNKQYLVGITILSVLIVILYVISHANPVKSNVNISKPSENSESLEWFNTLLQRWWLFSISGTENYFRNKINKIIQFNTPDFLEFIKVDRIIFGNSTPYASGIRFSDLTMPTGPPIYLTEKSLVKLIKFIKDARFYSVFLEFDVDFHLAGTEVHLLCKHKKFHDESKIILKDFLISGLVNLKITLDMAVAFPHISCVSMYFNDKKPPILDYSISLNNVSNLIDRFKFWITFIIHSNIVKQKFNLTNFELMEKTNNFLSNQQCLFGVPAIGVLIVRINIINQSSGLKNNFKKINLCTICMGNEFKNTFQTESLFSVVLLVQNILEEYVIIKLKSQNAIGIQTLATFTLNLKDYPLEIRDEINVSKNDNHIDVTMKLEYVKLDPIMRESEIIYFDNYNDSGILHIDIIAANNLLNNTFNNTIDSYCVLFANQHKIASSKVIKESRYPKWNDSVEFFIYSLSKVSLMFVVYNEKKLNEDGLHEVIGVCSCPINDIRKNIINCSSSLTTTDVTNNPDKAVGTIVYSVVFLPVEAVKYASNIVIGIHDDDVNNILTKDNFDLEENGKSDKPLLKLEVKAAKNLTKMDLIGSSDPYFKIKRNGVEIYKSKFIKNTLEPQWNEKINIPDFEFQDILKIELYDRDIIKRDDFMGQLVLDARMLHDLSMLSESKWFHLENLTDGDIHLEATFSRQDEICHALDCHDNHDSKNLILENNIGHSDSDTFPSSVPSIENLNRSKRLFGEVYSVVLMDMINNEQLILKANIKRLTLPSKGKNIIKAYSTSQFQKTVFFSNYAFAIMYSPSKEHLKLKFTLIQKKTKKRVDELLIEIKKFANLLQSTECQLRMVKGSVINIQCKEKED